MNQLVVASAKGEQSLALTSADYRLRVSELLRRKHLPLNTRCGQRGLCDGCLVELVRGKLIDTVTGETATTGLVRGCEYRLAPDSENELRIPPRSLLAYQPQVVSEFKTKVPRAHDPLWQQVPIPPVGIAALQRRRPVRLADGLAPHATGYATLEYRDDHWLVTGVAATPDPAPLGVAIDIGTTTVAMLLVDLRDGKVLSGAANFNRQMHLGDDVLTRINLCSTDSTMLRHLQELVVKETIAPLIVEMLTKAGAQGSQLRCIAIAANTTMLHLFAGIDPSSLGVAPFTPVFLEHRVLAAEAVGLPYQAAVHLLPGAAAYVGADLTAGAFATGLVYDEGPCLLVDVGTNGEIILKRGDRLYGCATAAGPAFEGAGLTNGVRAVDGAISHLSFTRDPFAVKIEKIGKGVPIGLCGTAYVDFLAQGRRVGLLSATGRYEPGFVADGSLKIATNVFITELDTARLLQAKAAIAAGILILMERVHLQPAQIKTLYLAGGFGLHLNREHTIGCGLLPGFTPNQIEVVGNTSLAGAYLSLLDCGALDEIARAGKKMDVIELNQDPNFEDRYIEQLALPG